MQWLNSLVSEFEGKPLQKAGMLTQEQLYTFFQKSAAQFSNPDFKHLLALVHKHGRSTEDAVNGMQREIFEGMGVQSDFGISCLARVQGEYGGDAVFMRAFYEHVQKEEMLLDEAELPEDAFRSKYEALDRQRAAMDARVAALRDLPEAEQQQQLAAMMQELLAAQVGGECCRDHGRPGHVHGPACASGACGPPGAVSGPGGAGVMSEAEQLAFFASLSKADGGK